METIHVVLVYVLLLTTIYAVDSQTTLMPTPPGPVKASYVIVSPQFLRPGSAYDVSVQILPPLSTSVQIEAMLYNKNARTGANEVLSQSTAVVPIELAVQSIKLMVPATASLASYTLQVKGSGGLIFTNETTVTTEMKTLSTYIQTDKAIYKPGAKVRLRVFSVDEKLLPYKGTHDIIIKDPNESQIKQWLKVSGTNGVFSGDLQLSDYPVLGLWTIHVTSLLNGGTEKVLTFRVEEYVLPKFEVSVKLPSFLQAESKSLPITVNAKYTYGKPVRGKVQLSVKIQSYGTYEETQYNFTTINRTLLLTDGIADTVFTHEELLRLAGSKTCYNSMCYSRDLCAAHYAEIDNKLMDRTIIVIANVTETVTGNEISNNATISFVRSPLTLKFHESTPSTFKPGLWWNAIVQLVRIDNAPLTLDDLTDYKGQQASLQISITCYQPNSFVTSFNELFDNNGFVWIKYRPHINATSCTLQTRYMYSETSKSIEKFVSSSQQGIQVSLLDSTAVVKVETPVKFHVATTSPIDGFYYMLLSKGRIIQSEYIPGPLETKTFELTIARHVMPSARMFVWTLLKHFEVVADSMDFNVEGDFANDVKISFEKSEVRPGAEVDLEVEATPGSYAGLLAVDKSVLLLAGSNDITHSQVMDELRSYGSSSSGPTPMPYYRWWWPVPAGGRDTSTVIKDAGLKFMTDGLIHEIVDPLYIFRNGGAVVDPLMGAPGPDMEQKFMPDAATDDAKKPMKEPDRVRTEFPETWIWTEEIIGADGKVHIVSTVPDTITSWVASAFALSDRTGLGVAKHSAQLTVVQPFFVSLNLPYSVIRGEEIALQITIFNYLQEPQTVSVTLESSEFFHIRDDDVIKSMQVERTVKVPANDAALVSIWLVPVRLGQMPIRVIARSTAAADAVERLLIVKPEGVLVSYSKAFLFQLEGGSQIEEIKVEYPDESVLVPGSERTSFTVIGDIMGPSINGLDNLLGMPYGCGEQNMIKFAPNIYILKYLQATNQLTDAIEQKALNYLETGYQRELLYQRNDGSFSAFGNADKQGSVWLTAFVVRCFQQAKAYILIDQSIIDKALHWLTANQNKTGAFQEPEGGRVIHTNLQGGSSMGLGLSAYVLATLLESNDASLSKSVSVVVTAAISSATLHLENLLSTLSTDPYTLSLVTYTLSMARSNSASMALEMLNKLKTTKGSMTYWTSPSDTVQTKPVPYWYEVPSYDIEMTSYALLTYTYMKYTQDGAGIAGWLATQRNSLGGYRSTQDTVLALQALSGFQSLLDTKGKQSVNVKVDYDGEEHSFETIEPINNMNLQSFEMTRHLDKVKVTALGTGLALFQMNLFYHEKSTPDTKAINLIVTSQRLEQEKVKVTACTSWKQAGSSGMMVVEVNPLTGYSVQKDGLLEKYKAAGLKLVEESEKKLILYLDELSSKELCLEVITFNEMPAANLKEAIVSAYSYYDPGQTMSALYLPEDLKNVKVCAGNPASCQVNSDIKENVAAVLQNTNSTSSHLVSTVAIATVLLLCLVWKYNF